MSLDLTSDLCQILDEHLDLNGGKQMVRSPIFPTCVCVPSPAVVRSCLHPGEESSCEDVCRPEHRGCGWPS